MNISEASYAVRRQGEPHERGGQTEVMVCFSCPSGALDNEKRARKFLRASPVLHSLSWMYGRILGLIIEGRLSIKSIRSASIDLTS